MKGREWGGGKGQEREKLGVGWRERSGEGKVGSGGVKGREWSGGKGQESERFGVEWRERLGVGGGKGLGVGGGKGCEWVKGKEVNKVLASGQNDTLS